MTSDVLELVSLALYDHGPLTVSDLATMTCLPLPSIRMHLQLNRGTRYQATLVIEDGIPVRRWIADVFDLPGCLAYGETEEEAVSKVAALAVIVMREAREGG